MFVIDYQMQVQMRMHVSTLIFIVKKSNKLDLTKYNTDTSAVSSIECVLAI
jgi:hypothetical protein